MHASLFSISKFMSLAMSNRLNMGLIYLLWVIIWKYLTTLFLTHKALVMASLIQHVFISDDSEKSSISLCPPCYLLPLLGLRFPVWLMWCDLLPFGFWKDFITINTQLRVSAGFIADMLIPYETLHNGLSSSRERLSTTKSILVVTIFTIRACRFLVWGLIDFIF